MHLHVVVLWCRYMLCTGCLCIQFNVVHGLMLDPPAPTAHEPSARGYGAYSTRPHPRPTPHPALFKELYTVPLNPNPNLKTP
jgi:hypothetical protein